jgi:multidrug efflux pump subunit AcrA (membrane-fusion protein)
MANDREDPNPRFDENDPNQKPRLSDGREHLGEEFVRPVPHENRELGEEFTERNTYEGKHLGEEFADTSYSGDRELGRAFADPNSLDDTRLGKEFEKTNSSAKKHHRPVGQVVSEPFTRPKNKKVLFIVVAVAVLVFLLVLFFGWIPRHDRNKSAEAVVNQENQPPTIEVVKVTRAQNKAGLVLPGTTTPLTESSVYARANGYLKKRYVDIGDHVYKGQLLAIIDAPDLDAQVAQARQQLNQAESQLAQQETQLALTKVTVDRYRALVARGVFSRQDGDQREADYQAQVANVGAAERNVEAFRENLNREVALQSYERITAPFTGIITQRNVDDGDLISTSGSSGGTPPTTMGSGMSSGQAANAGTNSYGSSGTGPSYATPNTGTGTNGGALFTIAQNDRLRILVSVPEGYVNNVRIGGKAMLHFQEFPTATFYGDVTRTAGSIDQNTRTMITEIQVDNHAGHLLPGMYAVATFEGATGPGPLVISGDAIAIRNNTPTCAVIQNGKVKLVPVVQGRDFGPVTEIVAGLQEGDIIASTFTDEVKEGIQVRTHMSEQAQQSQKEPLTGVKPVPPGGSTQYGDAGIEDEDMQGQNAKPGQKQSQGASKSNGKGESKP